MGRIRRKVTVVLGLLVVTLVEVTPSATAAPAVPAFFGTSGWWNRPVPGSSDPDSRWMYASLPIACDDSAPAAKAFQTLWLYPSGSISTLDRRKVRRVLRAAASVFAASERRVIAGVADLLASRSPRFVTNSGCNPTVSEVPVPATYFASGDISDLWTWLRGQGYDDPGRKYLELTQHPLAAGPATTETYYDVNQPDPAHQAANTVSSQITIDASRPKFIDVSNLGAEVAHEMAHSLGAMGTDMPHYNLASAYGGHPTDCNDILCYGYGPGTPGATFTDCPSNRDTYRLDCGHDDYFTKATGGWTLVRWNVENSTYLWGN